MTQADISVFCGLAVPMTIVLDAEFRASVPNLDTWFSKMCSLEQVVKRAGYIKSC